MTEPTIICPNCKTEIKLTESLAAPLLASTRLQFEAQLAQKDSDIAQREQAMRDKEKALTDAKRDLDAQVADQVASQLKTERARVAAEEAKKAKAALANELEAKARELAELQDVLKERDAKLAEAQKAQAELIKKQRALDDARRELDLTVETRVQEGLVVLIRDSVPPSPLHHARNLVDELNEINEYARQFQHDTNPDPDNVIITASELKTFVDKALCVVHKGAPD